MLPEDEEILAGIARTGLVDRERESARKPQARQGDNDFIPRVGRADKDFLELSRGS